MLFSSSLPAAGGAGRLRPPQRDPGLLREQRENGLRLLSGGGGAERLRLRQAAVRHQAARPAGQGGPGSCGLLDVCPRVSPAAPNR